MAERHPIGFSTGALARGNFAAALEMLSGSGVTTVELSTLREEELPFLLDALPTLDLGGYERVSVHAPSAMAPDREAEHARKLRDALVPRELPCVLHPDALRDPGLWKDLGALALVENMDSRKPTGCTADELRTAFRALPDARLCFDVAHAWQVDPTMAEAERILDAHGDRLAQLHLSGIHPHGKHRRIDREMIDAVRQIAHRIPPGTPVILESPVGAGEVRGEVERAREALGSELGVWN